MTVEKIMPRTYIYNLTPDKTDEEYTSCKWARFVFDCDNGTLNISSYAEDYYAGDYSYRWGYNEHEDFMHLMGRVDKEYLLNKLSSRFVFLVEESRKKLIKQIEYDGWDCYGIESEDEWERLKQRILDIAYYCSEETYLRIVDDLIPDIDFESIIIEKDYPYGAKVIVDMFQKYLQPQIKEEFVENSPVVEDDYER